MKKIREFENGSQLKTPLLISQFTKGVTQNGAPYLSIVFQDDTGTIEGKWWDIPKEMEKEIEVGRIGLVNCDVLLYRNKLQIRVHGIDFSESYELSEFVPSSMHSKEHLESKINEYILLVQNPIYRQLVEACFENYGEDFYLYPAATRNHHDFVGGLATHVIAMCELAIKLKETYPQIDLDLLLSGALVHDMGKIEEYNQPVLSEYTPKGRLLGHISIMDSKLFEIAKKLNLEDSEEVMLLRHLILSHHGQLEYGSPVKPQVIEAELLHFIDNIDARMNMFDKMFVDVEEGAFSLRQFALENRSFYKPKGE